MKEEEIKEIISITILIVREEARISPHISRSTLAQQLMCGL